MKYTKSKTRAKIRALLFLLFMLMGLCFFFQVDLLRSISNEPDEVENTPEQVMLLQLVNQDHPWPQASVMNLRALYHGKISVDERIYEPLVRLLQESSSQGIYLKLAGGYRTENTQRALYEQYKEQTERIDYCDQDLPPGSSEHQSALAVDLVPSQAISFDPKQDCSPACQWLKTHCIEYGFILRYPQGKEEITKHAANPWHYRYVGVKAARQIKENDLCLEEYLQLRKERKV